MKSQQSERASSVFEAELERPQLSARKLILVIVVLPSIIVLIDHWAMDQGSYVFVMSFFYPFVVIQVAILGWCVGRYVELSLLRWVVFCWTIALVDLQAYTAMHSYGDTGMVLGFALFASQVGMLVLWLILGPPPWTSRLSAAVVALAVILAFLSTIDRWSTRSWPTIMLLHCAIVVVVCLFLSRCGFRLKKTQLNSQLSHSNKAEQTFQFSVQDLLLWTTLLAPLVLIAKGLDVVLFSHLTMGDIYPLVFLAIFLALTSILSIWVSLGTGSTVIRILVVLAGSLLMGLALHYQAHSWHTQLSVAGSWWGRGLSNLRYTFIELRDLWVYLIQMELWLLAAMLLFLRASDYQLLRTKVLGDNHK